MDRRGRIIPRNWNLSHNSTDNGVASTILMGYHETSLKMGSYSSNREHNSPSIDLQWVRQGSFLPNYEKDTAHLTHSTALTSPSLLGMHEVPPQAEMPENPLNSIVEKEKKGKNVLNKSLRLKEPKKKEKKGSDNKTGNKKNEADQNAVVVVKQKRNQDEFLQELQIDVSAVPTPICSCTGVSRQCYRWGLGGWQSSCCTTTISEYPLPVSQSRPGARMSGRKMSVGAFKRVLLKPQLVWDKRLSCCCSMLPNSNKLVGAMPSPVISQVHWVSDIMTFNAEFQ